MSDVYGVGGVAGSIGSAVTSKKRAQEQRRFIREMRATAYQATMKDMRAAGLNPILAYKTGPTPIGAAAMGTTPDFGQAMASGVNAGVRAIKAKSEIAKTKADTAKSKREALKTEFQGRIEAERYNARMGQAQVDNINANTSNTNAKTQLLQAEIPRAEAIKHMDETKAGQYMIQGTTQIQRATGALGRAIKGR